jgi:endonuclease
VAIYDRPVRLLIREMLTELAPEPGKVFTREQATSWFAQHYPRIKEGTVTAHLLRFSTNARSRVHYNPRSDEDLLFQIDRSRFRLYDPATDPPPIGKEAVASSVSGQPDDEDVAPAPSEFAYESDLRDFLAKHLTIIEPGLRLYEEEGITGVEFPVGGRFVDILGVDARDRLVVIELKVHVATTVSSGSSSGIWPG